MMTYKEIIHKYSKDSSNEQMEKLLDITDDYIENPYDKEEFFENVESIFSKHLTMNKAKKLVNELQNDDGSTGEHWTPEQISIVWKNAGYPLETEDYNHAEIYYVMNMVYSDYYKMYKDNVASYLMHTYLFLNDKDWENEDMSKAK